MTPLQPIVFSTRTLPPSVQRDAWRDFMSAAIEFDVPSEANGHFVAEQTIWDFGRFAFSRAVMTDTCEPRTWRHRTRNPLDHWCFVLVPQPFGAPPRLHVRSLADPFEGQASDEIILSLYLPRACDSALSARLDHMSGEIRRSTMVDLFADYLQSLERRLPSCSLQDIPSIVRATEAILAACITDDIDDRDGAQEIVAKSLLDRARRFIRCEMASPQLAPETLARALGISRSGLYRAFEPFGGVRHVIQQERLRAAHATLSDPGQMETIQKIAENVGFSDASGFSRAFRQHFGYSPSHARAVMPIASETAAPAVRPLVGDDLGSVLRRLHA